MARSQQGAGKRRWAAEVLVLGLWLTLTAGCAMPDPRVVVATARAAIGGAPTATLTSTPAPTATHTPTIAPVAAAPRASATSTVCVTPSATTTPSPTATSTPTISMLVGPAVPWLTVQACTSTPRPAYVPATPPSGPSVATIPPLVYPGSAAPTWTPAPTVFPLRPGEVITGTPSASTGPELELLSMAEYVDEAAGEVIVTGEVRNIGARTLEGVSAVVNLYDAQDRFLGTGSAPIVYPSLPPGQRSPFAVSQSLRPELDHYTVEFLDGTGMLIETKDARE